MFSCLWGGGVYKPWYSELTWKYTVFCFVLFLISVLAFVCWLPLGSPLSCPSVSMWMMSANPHPSSCSLQAPSFLRRSDIPGHWEGPSQPLPLSLGSTSSDKLPSALPFHLWGNGAESALRRRPVMEQLSRQTQNWSIRKLTLHASTPLLFDRSC